MSVLDKVMMLFHGPVSLEEELRLAHAEADGLATELVRCQQERDRLLEQQVRARESADMDGAVYLSQKMAIRRIEYERDGLEAAAREFEQRGDRHAVVVQRSIEAIEKVQALVHEGDNQRDLNIWTTCLLALKSLRGEE